MTPVWRLKTQRRRKREEARRECHGVRCWGLIALLLLPTPLAGASAVGGHINAGAWVSLPTSSILTSTPTGLFVPSLAEPTLFNLTSPEATVQLFENSYIEATLLNPRPKVVTSTDRPTWVVRDAAVTLDDGPQAGWIGFHPNTGILRELTSEPTSLTLTQDGIGNGQAGPGDSQPSDPYYLVVPNGLELRRTDQRWSFDGSGSVKILGPRITIEGRENTTAFQTGETRDPSKPGQTTLRWIVIEFSQGTIAFNGSATDVLSKRIDASWNGVARFEDANGSLVAGVRTYAASGEPTTIDGTFSGTMTAEDGPERISIDLTGELRSSTMVARISVPSPAATTGWWSLVLVVGLAAATAGAYRFGQGRRSLTPTIGPDEYAQLADLAADTEDFEQAAMWIELARVQCPGSKRLALDHAYCLSRTGRRADAIRLLMNPLLAEDSDASSLLTNLYVKEGRKDDAAHALIRALELSPMVLFDIETDEDLSALAARPDVKQAIRRARRDI